jgi:hypothetical protein
MVSANGKFYFEHYFSAKEQDRVKYNVEKLCTGGVPNDAILKDVCASEDKKAVEALIVKHGEKQVGKFSGNLYSQMLWNVKDFCKDVRKEQQDIVDDDTKENWEKKNAEAVIAEAADNKCPADNQIKFSTHAGAAADVANANALVTKLFKDGLGKTLARDLKDYPQLAKLFDFSKLITVKVKNAAANNEVIDVIIGENEKLSVIKEPIFKKWANIPKDKIKLVNAAAKDLADYTKTVTEHGIKDKDVLDLSARAGFKQRKSHHHKSKHRFDDYDN